MVESIFSSFESKWFGLKCGPFHLSQQQSVTVISSFSYLDRFSCSVAALIHHRKYLSIYLSGIPVALLLCLQISCFVCTWLFFFHKNWMFWCEPSAGFFCFIYFFWKSEESPFSVKDWLQVNHSCWMLYYTINRTYPSSTWENDLQSRYFSWLE